MKEVKCRLILQIYGLTTELRDQAYDLVLGESSMRSLMAQLSISSPCLFL